MLTGRMGRCVLACIAAITLLVTLAPLTSQANDVDPFGFSEDDYSSWGIVDAPYPFEGHDKHGNYIGYGCFPVGNGLVFAHLGVDGDFNTLRGITGPGYQTRDEEGKPVWWQEGEWPDLTFDFWKIEYEPRFVDGQQQGTTERYIRVEWTKQTIQCLRGSAVIRTLFNGPEGQLQCLTYAIANQPGIVREYAFSPLAPEKENASYALVTPPGSDKFSVFEPKKWLHQGAYLNLHCSWNMHSGSVQYHMLKESDAGKWQVNLVLEFEDTNSPVVRKQLREQGFAMGGPFLDCHQEIVDEYRDDTIGYWQSWSAQNRQFDTGDARLDDMLIQIPVIIETQRDHYSGGVSPIVSYHGYWVRDHNGPILTYLANGRFDEVMRMLRYHRAACLHYKHCWMQVPLDLDLSELPGWEPEIKIDGGTGGSARDSTDGGHSGPPHQSNPTAGDLSHIGIAPEDWAGVTVEQAEVPSWIVLQHFWLWQAMHEAGRNEEADEFIREAWPFIAHNLFSMPVDPQYGVKFHGDETYAGGALYSTYDSEESGAIGYPNGYIPTEFYSFDNTLIHYDAAGAVLFMANSLGYEDDRARAEELLTAVKQALGAYDQGNHWSPAVSPVTGQEWPTAFSNIALRPFWLGIDKLTTGPPPGGSGTINMLRGPVTMAEHYDWTRDQLWQTTYPATTPWSGYSTGHNLGYWLSAATAQGDQSQAIVAMQRLLDAASPESAFCEILDAGGRPVNIYGRINRIRPWESGINYHALVNYLDKQTGWFMIPAEVPVDEVDSNQPPPAKLGAYPYPMTEVLVLATDPGYMERLVTCDEFAAIDPERVKAWDAGLPFSQDDLRAVLLGESGAAVPGRDSEMAGRDAHPTVGSGLRIPFLFIDSGVRDDLDRRTFKDHDFWYGEEMAQLIADFEELGGVVIHANDLSRAAR